VLDHVGAASAHGFWTGYLQDVAEAIRDAGGVGREVAGVLPAKHQQLDRVYVLIPGDCQTEIVADAARTENAKWLELGVELTECHVKPIVVNRSGVRRRTLGKHSIYTVKGAEPNDDISIALEFASPLRTLSEMGLPPDRLRVQGEAFHHAIRRIWQDEARKRDVPESAIQLIWGRTQGECVQNCINRCRAVADDAVVPVQ